MTKKLYVDYISPDGAAALTKHNLSVPYNMFILGRLGQDKSPIFQAGKYVCILTTDENRKGVLCFFDFKATNKDVGAMINELGFDEGMRMKMLALIELINVDYATNSSMYELVLGLSPAEPLDE